MHVIIVGSGIAGLVAAITLAEAGASVTLLESAPHPGGRARSELVEGAWLNLGPHAIYDAGAAARILEELGITVRGGHPPRDQFRMVLDGEAVDAPMTPWRLATDRHLTLSEKWELGRFLTAIYALDPRDWETRTHRELLDSRVSSPRVAELASLFTALGTYALSDQQSAATVLRQLRIGMSDVTYPDGGWQSLVDALVDRATMSGVDLRCEARVDKVRRGRVENGEDSWHADAVIVATPPAVVEKLTGHDFGKRHATRLATLDVVLDSATAPQRNLLVPDRGVYVSFHSPVADLGSGVVLHSARYLDPLDPVGPDVARADVENALDFAQPGWRDHVRYRRFLPRVAVNHWFCDAATGGQTGRPDVHLTDGIYVAGDWVGPEGMLADAAAASGRRAAIAALDDVGRIAA